MTTANLTGQRFGRLVVTGRATNGSDRSARWECTCDCGGTSVSRSNALRCGKVHSCGCLNREAISAQGYRHGMCGTPTYVVWASMLQRCGNPNSTKYAHYGARGIRVCERWHTFTAFLADMGERPANTEIDRIDGTKGYEPANCRWVDSATQVRNTNRIRLTPDMVKLARARVAAGETVSSVARTLGVSRGAIDHAVKRLNWKDVA